MASLDRTLHQLWQRFEDARQAQAYGLAILSLARLDEALSASNLPPDLRREWSRRIAGVTLDDDTQSGVRSWAHDYIDRVNLIVSTGGPLDSHDSLYVATAFECLRSVQKLLRQKDLAHLIDFDAADPDAFSYIRR